MGIPVHNSDLLYHIMQSVSTASSRYDAFFFFIQKTRRTQIKSPARFAICLVEKRDAADQRQGLSSPWMALTRPMMVSTSSTTVTSAFSAPMMPVSRPKLITRMIP